MALMGSIFPYGSNSLEVTRPNIVKRWFASPVANKWENLLTVYFEQVFFFVGVKNIENVTRVVFKGNPTRWDTCAHRIHLDIRQNDSLSSYSISLRRSSGRDEQMLVSFTDVPPWRITQTPEVILNDVHESLSR